MSFPIGVLYLLIVLRYTTARHISEHTNERPHQQTRRIAIPSGGGNNNNRHCRGHYTALYTIKSISLVEYVVCDVYYDVGWNESFVQQVAG